MAKKKAAEKPTIKTTAELTADPRNPRHIQEQAAAGLSVSLHEFGDLSGIVFNTRTSQLVCGHQRIGEIRKRWGELPIDGDVIRSPNGHEFRVRSVDWPIEKQRAANVAANSQHIAGEFTDDLDAMLSEIATDSQELYDSLLFDQLASLGDDAEPAVELKQIALKPPPKMAWCLIGIPTVRYGEIAADMERIGAMDGVITETTSNDG